MSTTLKLIHPDHGVEAAEDYEPLPVALRSPTVSLENAAWLPAAPVGAPLLVAVLSAIWILVGWSRLTLGDYWLDLAGAQAAATGSAPAVDGFARWLLLLWDVGAAQGLLAGHAALVAATFAAAGLAAWRRGGNPTSAALLVAAAAAVCWPWLGEVGSPWFTALAATILATCINDQRGPHWTAAPVIAVWTLVDESVAFGLILVAAAAIGARSNRKAALGVAGLSVLVAVAAPGGGASLIHFLDRVSLAEPVALGGPGPGLFFAAAAAMLVASTRLARPLAFASVAGAAVALADASYVPAWTMVAVATAACPLAERVRSMRREEPPTKFRAIVAWACVFIAICWSPLSGAWLRGRALGTEACYAAETPIYLVDALTESRLAGRVACPPEWSGFVQFASKGRLEPLATSRDRLSRPGVWGDCSAIMAARAEWRAIAAHHDVNYVLADRALQRPLLRQLETAGVNTLYNDQQSSAAALTAINVAPAESVQSMNAAGVGVSAGAKEAKRFGRVSDGEAANTNHPNSLLEPSLAGQVARRQPTAARWVLHPSNDKPSLFDPFSAALVQSRADATFRPRSAT